MYSSPEQDEMGIHPTAVFIHWLSLTCKENLVLHQDNWLLVITFSGLKDP